MDLIFLSLFLFFMFLPFFTIIFLIIVRFFFGKEIETKIEEKSIHMAFLLKKSVILLSIIWIGYHIFIQIL